MSRTMFNDSCSLLSFQLHPKFDCQVDTPQINGGGIDKSKIVKAYLNGVQIEKSLKNLHNKNKAK